MAASTSDLSEASLIDITVKTLDGQNRTFGVPDNLTVRQFKEKISGSIKIAADVQRLIFQGRVMQDDKALKDYDIHGKVIHLVQRPPPSSLSGTPSSNANSEPTGTQNRPPGQTEGNIYDVQVHLGRVRHAPNSREARARIRQAEFNLGLLNVSLNRLERLMGTRNSEAGADNSSTDGASEEGMDTSPPAPADSNQAPADAQPGSSEAAGNDASAGLRATELADFLSRVAAANNRLTPHVQQYGNFLSTEEEFGNASQEASQAQERINLLSEAMHAMSHIMHSVSDVAVDMNTAAPRSATAAPPAPFPIPGTTSMAIPIHMNVRPRHGANGNRQQSRSQQPGQATPPASAATTAATSAASTTFTIPSSSAATAQSGNTRSTSAPASATSTATISHNAQAILDIGHSFGAFQLPPGTNVAVAGDPTVMVDVFPAGVHDIRAVFPQISEAPSNTATAGTGLPTQSVSSTAATTTSSASTPTSTGPPPPPSTPRTSAPPGSVTTSTASFMFRPSSNVNVSNVVPGMPAGMLENILGSIFTSHGFRPDQQVQVNVQQAMGGIPRHPHPPHPPHPPPRDIHDIPLFGMPARPPPAPERSSTTQQSSVGTASSTNASTTARTNTGTNTVRTSASSIGTHTDPSLGTSSRSTNTPHPTLHIHRGQVPGMMPGISPSRPHFPEGVRMQGGGTALRGYVDPYLPCSSVHYNSQSARAAFQTMQGMMGPRGQQPQQQQGVPNLSTMVSGMVSEIIGQVGQAAINTSNVVTSSTSTSATPATGTAPAPGAPRSQPAPRAPVNPMEMFASMMGGVGNTGSPVAIDVRSVISSMVNPGQDGTDSSAPPPSGQQPTPGGGTLADLFTQFRATSDENTNDNSGNSNMAVSLLEAVAPHMRLTDLFSLVMGNTRVVGQLRTPLRDFVRARVVQHGTVDQVVLVSLEQMFTQLQQIESLVEVREGVDMAMSLRACLQVHMKKMFTFIDVDTSGTCMEYGQRLYALWMSMMAELISLSVYCIRNGQSGFSDMLQAYMPQLTEGINPAISTWMATSLQITLGSFYRNHPVPETSILPYVVHRAAARSEEASSSLECEAEGALTPTSAPGPSPDSAVSPMEVGESPSSQPPRAKIPRTAEEEPGDVFVDAAESFASNPTTASRPEAASVESARALVVTPPNGRNGQASGDWQSAIPQEWIPVISRDLVRQQSQRTQGPFSDGYLQGLPAKRRRMMALEHAGEMGNMPQYLPASLQRAARAAGAEPISSEENMTTEAADNLDLQSGLAEEVCAVLESRIASDPDYSSERFPKTKEYFHKSKRH